MAAARLRKLAVAVEERLSERYGEARKARLDPLDELILTILSQNTTDVNRDRAWSTLKEEYTGWEEVRDRGREPLERTIRVAGLAQQKSRTILRALETLSEEGPPSLERLSTMADTEALEFPRP